MVSGFTDDQPVHEGNRQFADNWDLSAQRALTVTRALINEGVPSSSVFVAAFGSEQPVSSNADEQGRAKNRRVEIRSEEHTSELQSLMRIPYAVFCLKKKTKYQRQTDNDSLDHQQRENQRLP